MKNHVKTHASRLLSAVLAAAIYAGLQYVGFRYPLLAPVTREIQTNTFNVGLPPQTLP
jgi:hypothetical protein